VDDLNYADVPEQIFQPTEEVLDGDYIAALKDDLQKQYQDFENLGFDLLKDENNEVKELVLDDFLEYIDKYLTIDSIDLDDKKWTIENGYNIYKLICVDSFNIFIPNFFKSLSISSIESLDNVIKNEFKYEYNLIKNKFLETIQNTLNLFLHLKKMITKLEKDEDYNNLMSRFQFYLEIIKYTDGEKFIEEYLHPVCNKNINELLWRIV